MDVLELCGIISMSLTIGMLVAIIGGLIFDRAGEDTAPIEDIALEALRDQRERRAWPSRGQGVLVDTQQPGRHRRLDAAMALTLDRRPSLAAATLDQALTWLAVDRVKREAERVAFQQLLVTTRRFHAGRPLLSGHR